MIETEEKVAVEWAYQTEDFTIVPYVGGMAGVFPEDFLVQMYFKLKRDGSLRRAMPDVSKHTLCGFVSYFAGKTMLICLDKKPDDRGKQPVAGVVWLYDAHANKTARRASVGVFFFKEYWGNKIILDMARMTLRWMFEVAELSVVIGTIAAWNRASVRFGRVLGFKLCGIVPMFFLNEDSSTDMVMVAIKKEEFV